MRITIGLALVGFLFLVGTAYAEEEHRIRVFVAASRVLPMDETTGRLDGAVGTLEVNGGTGWEAGVEWRFSPRLGLEASVASIPLEVEFARADLGELDFEPLFVALNVHVFDGARLDWWIAPTVMLLDWKNPRFERGVEIGDDSEEVLGATVGIDCSLGDHWALTAAVRYFDLQLRFGGGGEAAVDPLVGRLGFAWRF